MLGLDSVKNWSSEVELGITKSWRDADLFKFDIGTKKNIYSIDTPPPYINQPIHIGHATTYSFMDMFARYKRMKGYEVLFPLGMDRNGLPIEIATEKKFNISAFKVGREKFIESCEKLLQETSLESTDSFEKLGISFTSYKIGNYPGSVYFTDSPEYRTLTQATFIALYKKGLIYEDNKVSNWDPKLQTTVADSEIDYVDLNSTFNYVQWNIKGSDEKITIGTTRPELIATCKMVIYNPDDERYKHLKEKIAITPIFNKEVKIMPHPFAQADKGSGLVMMCSAGDLTDIRFFREMGLEVVIAINKDGTMNENAGFLNGLKVKDARKVMIDTLKEKGLIVKSEPILHRTPISERSKAEIEFISMPEFYLKQLEFKEDILEIEKKMKFFPEESREILESWISQVSIDWPISRRRFYATEVPLWYSADMVAVPQPGRYYRPWKEDAPQDADVLKGGKVIGKVSDFKDAKWEGDPRVLDTWFDSSISELFITKYKSDDKFFNSSYPVSLRPQGKEIVRTWLYYTVLRGYLETGRECFKDVWIHQHVLDEKGIKMSKSLGNTIDPHDIMKEFGAEAFRLWAASEGDMSRQDLSCSKDKIRGELKTINKILNVARFIAQFDIPDNARLTPTDQLFVDYIEYLTEYADTEYEKYNFYHPSSKLKQFLWDDFASNYLELVKDRAYNNGKKFTDEEQRSAHYALHYIFKRFIILTYPIIPQVCSVIGQKYNLEISALTFPSAAKGKSDISKIEKIKEFDSTVWKTKKERGMSLNSPISGIGIPEDLADFSADLKSCHHLE
ncbi:MAG: valine--tRNA ligase [Candidatus Micrarchaeota archaeon]|nr:valine--tRNA ligase [Candidatus Micrarchaeota archaeon]MDE1834057.1 valine--tRNA ligase [Candidatus Micrarchaeota archaeon]MDE1859171.1 valine--tRNA ligase [Candidatus Micrarchaeota archaeon]